MIQWFSWIWTGNSWIWTRNSWIRNRNLWIRTRKSWIRTRNWWIWTRNSWIETRNLWILTCNLWIWTRNSWIRTRNMWIQTRNSWIRTRNSWIRTRNSWIRICNSWIWTRNSCFTLSREFSVIFLKGPKYVRNIAFCWLSCRLSEILNELSGVFFLTLSICRKLRISLISPSQWITSLVVIFLVIWGKMIQASEAPDFLELHKNTNCVFPLID